MPKIASESLEVSVVVCTRNRAGPLRGFLESLSRIEIPPGLAWEVVIIDNGSSDNTTAVVSEFANRLPIHCVREEAPGLANARNAGAREARGRYICWTDDDVQLDPQWLNAYVEAFRRHPDAIVFAGRVRPVLKGPTPGWFRRHAPHWPLSDILAARDFGESEMPLAFTTGVVPWGANFAIRAAEQKAATFDPELGVSPSQRRSGEETQLIFELMARGATGWWVPASIVFHIYPTDRQTRRYFYSHYFSIGETWAYLQSRHARHCMNPSGDQKAMLSSPAPVLKVRATLHKALFAGFTAVGLTRRGLYSLRKAAMYGGAALYKSR